MPDVGTQNGGCAGRRRILGRVLGIAIGIVIAIEILIRTIECWFDTDHDTDRDREMVSRQNPRDQECPTRFLAPADCAHSAPGHLHTNPADCIEKPVRRVLRAMHNNGGVGP